MIYAHIVLIFLGFVALVIFEKESIERDNKLSKRIKKLNRQNQEIVNYISKNRGVISEEIRKVSKLEEKNSLLETLRHNEDALDYIQNQIYETENILNIDPGDAIIAGQLATERYIKFSLEYLDKCYTDRLKALGVKV